MTELHVLRVFIGPDGRGGNPLGVFVDGRAIAPGRRQAVAAELGFSETVFVDEIRAGSDEAEHGAATIRIFTPGLELPFAGHPTVGTSWLLAELGRSVGTLRVPAGDVITWHDPERTWIRARAEWIGGLIDPRQYATPADVDGLSLIPLGDPSLYAWAWEDEAGGRVRARFFATEFGILEDEATGAAAVVMGERLGRPLTIRQGVGSELLVRPDAASGSDRCRRAGRARRGPRLRSVGLDADRCQGEVANVPRQDDRNRREPRGPSPSTIRTMTSDRRDWDVIVVGLGALGSAAAYWASTRHGTRVLGLEQFELGHANGASADHSRIIRLSYHRPDYVRLAKRAYETWASVEAESRERIVTITGGLDLWPADAAIPKVDYTESLATEAVPFELLDAGEVMHRWPQWRLTDDTTALWQSRGGLADPFKGNAAHRRLATVRGATLLDRTPVTAIREVGGAYEVDAGGTTHGAGRVVLTADAWTNALLEGFDRRLPLTVTKEQVTYFAAPDPAAFAPDRFPVWIWMDEPCFYGFPTYGEAGPKAAQDCGGEPTTPETRTFERDEAAHARVVAFLETHLPRRRRAGHPDPDLPLHADPGPRLRRRPCAGCAGHRRRARCGARLQVRERPGPRAGRTGPRRDIAVGWGAGRVPHRSPDPARGVATDLLDGLTAKRRMGRAPLLHRPAGCATVPPLARPRMLVFRGRSGHR